MVLSKNLRKRRISDITSFNWFVIRAYGILNGIAGFFTSGFSVFSPTGQTIADIRRNQFVNKSSGKDRSVGKTIGHIVNGIGDPGLEPGGLLTSLGGTIRSPCFERFAKGVELTLALTSLTGVFGILVKFFAHNQFFLLMD